MRSGAPRPALDRDTVQHARPSYRQSLLSLLVFGAAAVAVIRFYQPPANFLRPILARTAVAQMPVAVPSADAFGRSGDVKVRFALPGDEVQYPLELQGDPSALSYQWVRLSDSLSAEPARPLVGARFVAPAAAGFYQLALVRGASRRVVDGMTLAVLVPFSRKLGTSLNGFRIGTYVAERLGGDRERPDGFVEIEQHDVDLPLTTHLRLADFIARDGQDTWPRYAALNPRLLDKLELVIAQVAALRGGGDLRLAVDVHSGYRTPAYNRRVKRAARDSRHQYGDAADVTIDADGDGRITSTDSRIISQAVEAVERAHPDLAGGLGVYTSRRYPQPYVHIDARGHRARWRG